MQEIKIDTDFIKLDSFMKWAGIVGSGSDAKMLILDGEVKLNGEVWTATSVNSIEIPKDANVVVEKIDGVKLIVKIA